MLFKEIIGQEKVKNYLLNSVKKNRISHAHLFTGSLGTGKLALSIAYAQYISCINRQENDSCNTCSSCIKYNKLIHPDLFFVFPIFRTANDKTPPTSDKFLPKWREFFLKSPYFSLNNWLNFNKTENKQGIIYAKESSEIIKNLSFKPLESEYKIMIIWHPEKMNQEGTNKLLKIIEEPPPKTIFLCVTEHEGLILPTLLSRLQITKIPPINNDKLKSALINLYHIEEDNAEYICKISRGNFLEAIKHINVSEEENNTFQFFMKFMRLSYSSNFVEIVNMTDAFHALGREKQKFFLNFALRMVRENFIYNFHNDNLTYLKKNEEEFSVKFSPFINEKNIVQMENEFSNAQIYIERNGYAKLIFIDLSIKIVKLLNIKPS